MGDQVQHRIYVFSGVEKLVILSKRNEKKDDYFFHAHLLLKSENL